MMAGQLLSPWKKSTENPLALLNSLTCSFKIRLPRTGIHSSGALKRMTLPISKCHPTDGLLI